MPLHVALLPNAEGAVSTAGFRQRSNGNLVWIMGSAAKNQTNYSSSVVAGDALQDYSPLGRLISAIGKRARQVTQDDICFVRKNAAYDLSTQRSGSTPFWK
jgi:hypothetical protein